MATGPGNCNLQNSELGSDGLCYELCRAGFSPVNNGPICAKNCPSGFASIGSVDGANNACIKPNFSREIKPNLACPVGADRQFDKCLLDCPLGTHKKYNLCIPDCPPNFVETLDGLSCQAEFTKRKATIREACYADESRVNGRVCLGPCPVGTVPYGSNAELCYSTVSPALWPYFWTGSQNFKTWTNGALISKVIFSRIQTSATCSEKYEPLNGQCFADCPTLSTALGTQCVADCPSDFRNTSSRSACIRPTYKRKVVRSILGSIESTVKNTIIVIMVILAITLLSRKL